MLKPVKGYEDYLISDSGKVYSLKTRKYLKQRQKENGYLEVSLNNKKFYVHRLVAEAFIDNPKKYDTVDHIDFNRQNNNIKNLRWLSAKENRRRQQKQNVVIEINNDEVSFGFISKRQVPGIRLDTCNKKGNFIVKQKNGQIRNFLIP